MLEFKLPDMTCGHCVATVTKTIQTLDPAAKLEFDRDARLVRISEATASREALAAALSEEGYPPAN